MESSEPLATESFSRSWLTSVRSPLDGLEEPFRRSLDSFLKSTSGELDCMVFKKLSAEEAQTFNFDVPISQCPDPLAHADQLFADGIIKPVYINNSKIEVSDSFDLAPYSSVPSRIMVPRVDVQCYIFKRWRKYAEQILQKCSGYLRPLCQKVIGTRKSTRVGDIDRRAKQVFLSRSSPQSSPAITYSSNDIEHSIYEAILHCKRSTDK